MATAARVPETEIVRRSEGGQSYVDGGAVLAGIAVATAISMLLVAFGSGIGISLTSFASAETLPGLGMVLALGLWLLWLQVTASLGGGYVTGRLRRRIGDAQRHEVEMRDGLHGLVVWAGGVIIGSLVAAWITTMGVSTASHIVAGAASNPQAASMSDYYVDRLLRPEAAAPAADVSADARAELGRLLSLNRITAADGEDRSYALQRISTATGLNEQAAAERLDSTLAAIKARADHARRLSVLAAFVTAASLLVSAVAAWWAATRGGSHRDEAIDHSRFTAWR
ncbi:hypothetical protein [Aestuariivirga sp.]|uniref:hypothetical protein n=1 Tax=Aestuariivirga sp. TaxID=2650926 RepID=UPI003BADB520